MITIESILLDRINELSQELAGVKHDLQRAIKEVSDLDAENKKLALENDRIYDDTAEATNHIIDLLLQVHEAYDRAEKDGAASFVEEIKDILDQWNITYNYK